MPRVKDRNTEHDILDIGQELMQTVGYGGFSYRDIADRIGIKTATIHYHFPSKAELAVAVTSRYRTRFAAYLDDIAAGHLTSHQRLKRYVGLFQATAQSDRVCLCGMAASESATLPEQAAIETTSFFLDQYEWLEAVLIAGAEDGTITPQRSPRQRAESIVATLEGAMLIGHSQQSSGHLDRIATQLLDDLDPNTRAA